MKKDKPWMSSGPSEYRTHSERYPMDLFSYTREAAHCLQQRRLLAVIAMSSTDSIAYPGLANVTYIVRGVYLHMESVRINKLKRFLGIAVSLQAALG
jgi:hypothetical protein